MTKPSVVLIQNKVVGRWTVEVNGFKEFKDALGSDVVNGFARCFVHADRLTSLIGFANFSKNEYGEDSPAFSRDLQTVVWFAVGTLRELALALQGVRSALAKRKLLDPDSSPWLTLRDVEKRWEDDPFFRNMRNTVAFHLDADIVDHGLTELDKEERVILIEGQGDQQRHAWLKLGLEAVFRGGDKDENDFERFISAVAQDQGVADAIQNAFVDVLDKAGIPYSSRANN